MTDRNIIIGPVCPAHIWKGRPDNFVKQGFSFEIYTRIDGKVGSHMARFCRTEKAAARCRRTAFKFDQAHGNPATVHVCTVTASF